MIQTWRTCSGQAAKCRCRGAGVTCDERRGQGTRQTRAASSQGQASRGRRRMTDAHARARVWTLCLAALVLAALTGPSSASSPRWLTPPRRLSPSWPPSSPWPSSARPWPSPSCSPSPSCASCGPARPIIGSPVGERRTPSGSLPAGDDRPLSGPYSVELFLVLSSYYHSSNGPHNVVPFVALIPQAWSYAKPPFHTGKWG